MRDRGFLSKVFSIGTPHCAVACALAGIFIALIAIWAGFWKALFVVAVVAVGVFVGGVKDKKRFFQKFIRWDSSRLH